MRIDVLGPLQVRPGCNTPESLLAKERAVLAALALNVGRPVRRADLEMALWGERPPRTAAKSLQAHVVKLRRCLGAESIVTSPEAYQLALPPEAIDVSRLERALHEAADDQRRSGLVVARDRLAKAERLWRGEPLTDLADTVERQLQVERLRKLWCQVRDARIQADLDLGHHVSAAAELERLVTQEPLREPLRGMLMLALYRAGHQIQALQEYQRLRERLALEWGVDPSPPLQRLQWQILRQDPQLDLRPPPPPLVVPAPLAPFVGRAGQPDNVALALASARMVTLHGPAGVGKSRLAQEVARIVRPRFPDGIWWVDLTVVEDGSAVPARIAQVLGVSAAPGVPMEDALLTHLAHRELLLVLDNCEHVTRPLSSLVTRVLHAAPGVRVLATSREFLGMPGEARWEVPPLSVPGPGADEATISSCDAVELFQQRRGRRVDSPSVNTLEQVGALCRRLDGLPLALELAAAQAQQLTVGELLDRLGREPVGVTDPGALRHSSVAQAIDWSYAELYSQCQQVFDWLSVFPGEFDAAAVASLVHATGGTATDARDRCLDRLVATSLVEPRTDGPRTRYRLLFVMREFASARLVERAEADAARQAFTNHYRSLADEAGPGLNGPRSGTWLTRATEELVNLRAALDWSVTNEAPAQSLTLVRVIGRVAWSVPPDISADLVRLRTAVEMADAAGADPGPLAWAWQELVTSAYLCGDAEFALQACDRADELFDQVGDRAGLAAVCWHRGGAHLLGTGDLDTAEQVLRRGQTIGREARTPIPEAWCCAHLGQLHSLADRVTDESAQALARAAEIADPDDYQIQSHLLLDWALLHLARGDFAACVQTAQQCQEYSHAHGNTSIEQAAMCTHAGALIRQGRVDAARPILLHAAQLMLDLRNSMQLGLALQPLARVADHDGDTVRAARLWGAGTARTPVWPINTTAYAPARAKEVLGDRFDDEVALGATLDDGQALSQAIG